MAEFKGPCKICGGWSNRFDNPCFCPAGPQQETEETVIASAMSSPVASLAVARFDKVPDPASHSPRAALEKALQDLDGRDEDKRVVHCIVLFGRTTEGNSSATGFFQAGTYAHHAQMGLLEEGKMMIRESCDRQDGQ